MIDGCNTDTETKKQGRRMDSECLLFNIDPNNNPDGNPPKPSGTDPAFVIFGTEIVINDGDSTFFSYSMSGYSSDDWLNFAPCDVTLDWNISTDNLSPPPDSIDGITGVFGDNCKYIANAGVSWNDAEKGDIVGRLDCDSRGNANCFKDGTSGPCATFGVNLKMLLVCSWP